MNTKIKIALLALGLAGLPGSVLQAKMHEIIIDGKKQVCSNGNQCYTKANSDFCDRLQDDSYSPSCYGGRCVCFN